jgi:hypothetical protein
MKIKLTAHIHYKKYSWDEKGEYEIWFAKMDDTDHRVYVGEQEVEIDVPDGFDPRAKQVAALQRQRGRVMAEYQKTVDEINERISNLQAITYTGEAS